MWLARCDPVDTDGVYTLITLPLAECTGAFTGVTGVATVARRSASVVRRADEPRLTARAEDDEAQENKLKLQQHVEERGAAVDEKEGSVRREAKRLREHWLIVVSTALLTRCMEIAYLRFL